MSGSYVPATGADFFPNPDDNVMDSIFKQYERVIVESIITSFGLDFLVNDRHGGDVDTIYNVRKIGKDGEMTYKNAAHQANYDNRGDYDSRAYHSDKRYIDKNREISEQKKTGVLSDAYTGTGIARNEKSDLDHVISAKEIHDDKGRVLAGIKGTDLANSAENLQATNPHANRTKKALKMDEFIERYGDEYTEAQKAAMHQKDKMARKEYEHKIAAAYYTSKEFAADAAFATGKVSAQMAFRQALGFVFCEVWFAVKEEFSKIKGRFDLGEFFSAIGSGIKKGFADAKEKYRELLSKFKEGAFTGALSSLTTTLCNIFFTTAKNVIKIIRQTYASVVQAAKVLFLNPENLPFGERMRAVIKILAAGASVVMGGIVSEFIGKTPIGTMPYIGEIVQTFCGAFVTGIMSCTLLYFLDRSEIINKLVSILNKLPTLSAELDYFRRQAAYFEKYAADLMKIDLEKFREESEAFNHLALEIENAKSERELNAMLKKAQDAIGVKIPWEGDFGSFMSNRDSVLVFQ